MSGGSYNYIYATLRNECEGAMYDDEMNELIKDLCEVLQVLEWWQSSDTSEEEYRRTLCIFKNKWLGNDKERTERLRGYVDNKIEVLRRELNSLIGRLETESEAEE